MLPPATALKYQISNIFDFKELGSSVLNTPGSSSTSSVVSTTTATNSSISMHQQESVTNSLHSSLTSINKASAEDEAAAVQADIDTQTVASEAAMTETASLSAKRIHELEQRCTQLEELVTALQL